MYTETGDMILCVPDLLLFLNNLIDRACIDCLWTDLGQEGGDGVWVAHMDVVDWSYSSQGGQADLKEAADDGSLFLFHLEYSTVNI